MPTPMPQASDGVMDTISEPSTAALSRGSLTTPSRHRSAAGAHIAACRYPAEWAAARALLTDYVAWLEANVATRIPDRELAGLHAQIAELPSHFADPDRLVLAWLGRVPAATLGVTIHDTTARFTRFFVRPVARGTGLAFALAHRVLGDLADEGICAVHLETLPDDMPAAVRLYTRLGFRPVGGTAACPGMLRMALDLGPGDGCAPRDRAGST